jgi:hypothetical protein
MSKIVISVVIGAVCGAALGAGYYLATTYGYRLSPSLLIVAAGAIAFGSAASIITFLSLGKTQEKLSPEKLMGKQLGHIAQLIQYFPTENVQALSIRPSTFAKDLDTVVHPEKYTKRPIVVSLHASTRNTEPFNPIKLREIFAGLRNADNFEHIILYDGERDFAGYIPAMYARLQFVGGDAETLIARAVTDIYAGSIARADLRAMRGAEKSDVISHDASFGQVLDRLEGGFTQLVVLRNGHPRQPIGLVRMERVIEAIKTGGVLSKTMVWPNSNLPAGDLRA